MQALQNLESENSSSMQTNPFSIHQIRDFYFRFFAADPTGKRLFENSGLKAQGRALVSMIGMIVRCLDDFSEFTIHIQRLGGRHNIYGVKQKDYSIFSKILSETIADLTVGSSELEPSDVQSAWCKVTRTLPCCSLL